ncbi:MAG: RpiB/LacA/LacB family sugar-phosphate isomerase [Candidatus Micrarchaeota archaeon]|nr:RpiB/LacA/LacB family sugar-phosphate isomerase [Candidatus Micrarchaeota archaeon]
MKVYILTDDQGAGIAVSNSVNASRNAGILGESAMGNDEMVNEVSAHLDDYDTFILCSSNPIPLNIKLNKLNGVRSAVCNSRAEASSAREKADANVYIIDSSKRSDRSAMISIVSGVLNTDISQARPQARPAQQLQAQSQRRPQPAQQPQSGQKGIFGRIAEVRQQLQPDDNVQQQEKRKEKDKRNWMESLKDTFGIEE